MIVRQAMKRQGNIQVVSYDWLEDSLLTKRPKNEKKYLLATIEKAKRRREKEEKRAIKTGGFFSCFDLSKDDSISLAGETLKTKLVVLT